MGKIPPEPISVLGGADISPALIAIARKRRNI